MADYGTDVYAVTDLPDAELLVSAELNVACALARRLLTPTGALAEIGETEVYDSINIADWLGAHTDLTGTALTDDLEQQATQVLSQDVRVDTVSVKATFAAGAITVAVQGSGNLGPFAFVLAVTAVSATFLRGG